MRLRQWLYPLAALLILAALFVGYITWTGVPKATYAVQPHTDNGLVGWPFVPSEASWKISQGYDARKSPDHNCYSLNCYERYGFDFVATNRSAAGLTVNSPATGKVAATWDAKYGQGICIVIVVDTSAKPNEALGHVVE